MKKGSIVLLSTVLSAIFLMGCSLGKQETNQGTQENAIRTFADWTETEIFQSIPAMYSENTQIGEVRETGGGKYTLSVNGTFKEDVQAYLQLLEEAGYKKYVDNGEEGLYGNVFTSVYIKDKVVLTVIYMDRTNITYLVAAEDEPLSEHLFYKEEYVSNNLSNAKTTLGMLELWDRGNSFVVQLKDGHFIICDGGHPEDAEYLLQYMEARVPKGEKPVVEAWFVSHPHDDHAQLFQSFATDRAMAERILVEGIYFSEYTDEMAKKYNVQMHVQGITYAAKAFKTTKGESSKIYHPHAGQRLYFNDITVDVLQTQEQMPPELFYGYATNDNENSMWLRFTIEGQTFLNGGDAELGSVKTLMRTYGNEIFKVDLFSVLHHGINVWDEITDHIEASTLLYPHYGTLGVFIEGKNSQACVPENEYLHTKAKEALCYGDGSKVLTFPYITGTAESLPVRGERKALEGDNLEQMIAY